jgi:hypothetical protein
MHDPHDENRCAVFVRLRGSLFGRFEDWRRSQPVIPSRSEALRFLIERALTTSSTATAAL